MKAQSGRHEMTAEAIVEPGFFHFGANEAAAVSMAVIIIVDWALFRYTAPR